MKRHAIAAEKASIADAEHGRPERSAIFRQDGMLLTKDPPAMRPVSKRGLFMTGRRQESTESHAPLSLPLKPLCAVWTANTA